ncbi:MAG: META domain-containing protein [Gammaproteobacteria bacterium]|jgi:putative lipoprotein
MVLDRIQKLSLVGLVAVLAACGPAGQEGEGAQGTTVEPVSLEGSNWQLVRMVVPGGFVFTPDDPSAYVLNFRSENRLTGSSDCNRITGSWQQEGMALSFEPFSTGRSLCPPPSLHNYLSLYLRDVTTSSFRDEHLFLTTTTEGVELEFEARE